MAFLSKGKKKVTAEVTTLAPTPPDAPVPASEPVAMLMSVDGGLNGTCWRAGQTVTLPAHAADFYLAKGYGKRAS